MNNTEASIHIITTSANHLVALITVGDTESYSFQADSGTTVFHRSFGSSPIVNQAAYAVACDAIAAIDGYSVNGIARQGLPVTLSRKRAA